MEKYSKWKDPATGIMPFLEPKAKRRTAAGPDPVELLMTYLIGPALVLLRLPVAIIALVLLPILSATTFIIPLATPRRMLRRVLQAPVAWLALFCFGYVSVGSKTVHPRQRSKKYTGTPGGGIQSGDLLVCNYASYIQAIYLCFRFSATFATLSRDEGDTKGPMAAPRGLWGAMRDAVLDRAPAKSDLVPLTKLMSDAKASGSGPVVIFPEGTTSNGLELLRFMPHVLVPALLVKKPTVHLVAFKFEPTAAGVTGAYTVNSPVAHALRLMAQPFNALSVHYCAADALPETLKTDSKPPVTRAPWRAAAPGTATEDVGEEASKMLAAVVSMHRAVTLGVAEKAEFAKYYADREYKGYNKRR